MAREGHLHVLTVCTAYRLLRSTLLFALRFTDFPVQGEHIADSSQYLDIAAGKRESERETAKERRLYLSDPLEA